jgi:ATP-binding cassette subfamily F protein 3
MSLISASNVSKSFGHRDIFSGVTLSIPRGARYAVVGANGVGKTTLLKILIGEEEASSGVITRSRGARIGYLPQEADFETSETLWVECVSVFADLIEQQDELHRLEALMADPQQAGEALARYGKLQDDFERRGGYTYQTRIRQVLTGLGFTETDYEMSLDHLSGGQRTRAYLARLLLSNPDLLLLDEPTNHLDIAAVEWLEGYLSQWEGAAVIVSHDRYFLDRTATDILEMAPGGTETYHGNYSAYLRQREQRWERRIEVFEAEKEKLFKEVEYIKKNISGQNTLQAKGKLKRLSRIVQAVEQVGMDAAINTQWSQLDVEVTTSPFSVEEAERRVRGLQAPKPHMPRLKLHIKSSRRSGDLVLRTRDLEVGYPGKPLFQADDLELRRGDCAALIGPNGAGKSTFLKTALEHLEPLSGEVILGASLHIGYFAQAHEGLNPENTLIQEIQTVAPNMLTGEVRDYLAKYLFSGDDVFKTINMLSGGERGRLALAKLALSDTNFLLLDEPTNHLDILSQEVLQAVLDNYTGTILLVSHDRYLIDALATQVWEIDPDESKLAFFKGTYSQMKAERERLSALVTTPQSTNSKFTRPQVTNPPAAKEERRKAAYLQELENKIAEMEKQLGEIGRQLETPRADPGEVVKLSKQYESVQREMDEKLKEWEERTLAR